MNKRNLEFYVGLFVIIGCVCSAYLISALGGVDFFGKNSYSVYAYFSSVSGLKTGASVEMAGVNIGQVTDISLDAERLLAKVEINLPKTVVLSEYVIASVKTSVIIGDKYISLSPGGSEMTLGPGDTIFNTESAIDIESLVSKYIFNKE